jgi:hypothetical protein
MLSGKSFRPCKIYSYVKAIPVSISNQGIFQSPYAL